jgi:hypothetical protein
MKVKKVIQFQESPNNIELTEYSSTSVSFSYPEDGKLLSLDHGEGESGLRIIYDLDRETRLRINIEVDKNYSSAKEAAEAIHTGASELFKDENVAPFAFDLNDLSGWRCRKRFVDGGRAPLIIDSAFLETDGVVYQLTFAATPSAYKRGKWFFDLLLQTFSFQ